MSILTVCVSLAVGVQTQTQARRHTLLCVSLKHSTQILTCDIFVYISGTIAIPSVPEYIPNEMSATQQAPHIKLHKLNKTFKRGLKRLTIA